MGSMKWTEDQQRVIDARDSNFLVSAAAGSGKTAVLVERIIQEVTDAEHPIDIDRLLVVTFTNAAAGEMRQRVGKALEEALVERPGDKRLQKQLSLLHNAQITTIDSFCQSIIRNYFHVIDLDPVFRVADDTEIKLMKQEVLDEVLEELRVQGVSSLDEVKYAVLETSGQLSVLLRADVQPATPKQMGLKVDDDVFLPVIIIDNGRLMGKNMEKMGLDEKWLQKQLKAHRAHRVQDVFLMTVDRSGTVVLAKKEAVK